MEIFPLYAFKTWQIVIRCTDRSFHRRAPPQCAPSGAPTRCCTWSRFAWLVWPCSTGSPACSWLYRLPPVPSETLVMALGGLRGRFQAAHQVQWSHRRPQLQRHIKTKWWRWETGEWKQISVYSDEKDDMEESWEQTVGQCIITTVFAWDYPFAQHSEFPIIWYFGMFTQVYFRAQEILAFLSGNKAAWIYRKWAFLV